MALNPFARRSTLVDRVSEVATRAQEAVVDRTMKGMNAAEAVAQNAVEALDQRRDAAARVLTQTASAIRDDASAVSNSVTTFAKSAATQMEGTARYIKRRRIRQMTRDLTRFIQQHPASLVMIAVAVGVVVGRATTGLSVARQTRR